MEYKVGMYGGCFDPLHIGHIQNIIKAAGLCEELYIVISWAKDRESVPKEIRYRWILNSTKHLPNIKILLIEDNAVSKEAYDNSYWEKGAKDIKSAIGKPIDVVFCGSDYSGTDRFEKLYKESKIYYFDRNIVPVSSTLIRKDPFKYWDYIPQICRSFYTKKILILGGESTGKSTLVQNLALVYNTNFVSEVGRDTCEYAGGEEYMIVEDLYENLLKQKINTEEAAKYSNKYLFVDTDCITTLFYSGFLFNEDSKEHIICKNLAKAINDTNTWDLILFLTPEVEFIQDGTRSEEIFKDRQKYSDKIEELLTSFNLNYTKISGKSYTERFVKCLTAINSL